MNLTPVPLFPLTVLATPWQVGPCYHGMARPKAFNMEVSCECIEWQSRAAGKGCSSSLEVGRGAYNSSP